MFPAAKTIDCSLHSMDVSKARVCFDSFGGPAKVAKKLQAKDSSTRLPSCRRGQALQSKGFKRKDGSQKDRRVLTGYCRACSRKRGVLEKSVFSKFNSAFQVPSVSRSVQRAFSRFVSRWTPHCSSFWRSSIFAAMSRRSARLFGALLFSTRNFRAKSGLALKIFSTDLGIHRLDVMNETTRTMNQEPSCLV